MALASNLASMETAIPKLETMAGLAEKAGLLSAQAFMDYVRQKTEGIRVDYGEALNDRERAQAVSFCARAREAARRAWVVLQAGRGAAPEIPPRVSREDELDQFI